MTLQALLLALMPQASSAQPADYDARTGGILVSDQTVDSVVLTRDLNGDGDCDDAGEIIEFFSANNASGLVDPTTNTFTIFQSASGYIYTADGNADAVFRLRDQNGDGDAEDAGEANVWFDLSNADGWSVTSPNGIWEAADGALYIFNAGTLTTPPDAIYRTEDLNDDGDANDPGEATMWMHVQDLVPDSSGFEIVFLDGVAYWADLVGGEADTIFRAEDVDGDGQIKAGEFIVLIDEDNIYGCPVSFNLTADSDYLYVIGSQFSGDPQVVARLKDLDGSGTIDSDDECVIVWDESAVPAPYELGSTFSIAVGPMGTLAVTSNGSSDADNVFLLADLNQDGDYMEAGETIPWAVADMVGDFVDRARAVEFILGEEPDCPGDLDGDLDVDQSDLGLLLASYDLDDGGDVDGDGDTDQSDLGVLLANYGTDCN